VEHRVTALCENATNEQAAMAVSRVFLPANQSHSKALQAGLKPRNGRLEAGIVAQAAVKDVAFGVVVGWIGRTSTQFRAEEEITNSRFLKRTLHHFLVELWRELRVGRTARIDYNLNPVLPYEGEPRRILMVRMAECEETAHANALAEEHSTVEVLQC